MAVAPAHALMETALQLVSPHISVNATMASLEPTVKQVGQHDGYDQAID